MIGKQRENVLLIAVFVAAVIAGSAVQSFDASGIQNLRSEQSISENPNVVVIMVNNLRPDHLSCNGYQRNTTPNICEFGKENIVFENAVNSAPWTLPSTVSFFVSQYPDVHGVTSMQRRISEETVTVTEVFKQEGYSTGAFVGNRRCQGGHLKAWYNYDQGFDIYHQRGPWFNTSVPRAIDWLEEEERSPYFMFVHGYDPHSPYGDATVNTSFMDDYDGKMKDYVLNFGSTDDEFILDNIEREDGRLVAKMSDREINITERDMQYIRAMYDRDLRAADEQIGRFINYLKKNGEYENTIVLITSNHGTKLGERTRRGSVFGHDFPYRGVTGGIMMMHVPGQEAKRVSTPTEMMDIYPTLMDITGFESSGQQLQGQSLVDLIESKEEKYPDRYVFSQGNAFSTLAVRNRDWKMIDPGYSNENIYVKMNGSTPVEVPESQVPEEVRSEFERQIEEWRLENSKLPDSSTEITPTGGCNDDLLRY